MLRIVKTKEGLEVDPEQRKSGRGAYVHWNVVCLDSAVKRGGLGKTLRCAVPAEVVERVVAVLGSQGIR
jgi:predicted RNA-binding protein YlxR (DUF448 family)